MSPDSPPAEPTKPRRDRRKAGSGRRAKTADRDRTPGGDSQTSDAIDAPKPGTTAKRGAGRVGPARKRAPRPRMVLLGFLLVIGAMLAATAVAIVIVLDDGQGDPPARVLLIGDSIMKQAGSLVEEELEAHPAIDDVEVWNRGENGTGLLTPGLFDWRTEAERLVDEIQPDIVVVLFVGNYSSEELFENLAGLEIEGYSEQFFDAWEREARALQQSLQDSDAEIYWVQPPPMLNAEGERRIGEFRTIYSQIAEDWGDTILIDGTAALSDADGAYAWELPDDEGVLQPVRAEDSVHLTVPHGARVLAREIARQVTPSLLLAQNAPT